jgi:hypothetical protein
MKNIILITISIFLLIGCKKSNNTPPPAALSCYCGDVELQYVRYGGPGQIIGWTYFSRNHCTNAVYKFETTKEYTEKEFCLNYQW